MEFWDAMDPARSREPAAGGMGEFGSLMIIDANPAVTGLLLGGDRVVDFVRQGMAVARSIGWLIGALVGAEV